ALATVTAFAEAFAFQPTVGIVAMMQDKDSSEVLRIFAQAMDIVVITKVQSSPRARDVEELATEAEEYFPEGAVHRAATMAEAIDLAVMLADTTSEHSGILIAGSVIAAGEARDLLGTEDDDEA